MSIRSTVISEVEQIAAEGKKSLAVLTDQLILLDSGLDSVAIAILVARLEETLGFDPFSESDDVSYPVTLGDFIRFYENAAKHHEVGPRQPGIMIRTVRVHDHLVTLRRHPLTPATRRRMQSAGVKPPRSLWVVTVDDYEDTFAPTWTLAEARKLALWHASKLHRFRR